MLGDEVVMLAGLSAGERVAAAGAFKLRRCSWRSPIIGEWADGWRAIERSHAPPACHRRARIKPARNPSTRVSRALSKTLYHCLSTATRTYMRSFTDIFIKHPVLADGRQPHDRSHGAGERSLSCRSSSIRR